MSGEKSSQSVIEGKNTFTFSSENLVKIMFYT